MPWKLYNQHRSGFVYCSTETVFETPQRTKKYPRNKYTLFCETSFLS